MNDVFKDLQDKFENFWYDIYNIEKKEIRLFLKYIKYCKEKMKRPTTFSNDYDNTKQLLVNKHFDYLEELYSNILIGNYNSSACLLRIIIENFTTFYFIKKFKKEEIYKDWILWSSYKAKQFLNGTKYQSKLEKVYDKLKKELNCEDASFNNQSYIWLNRVLKNVKNYSFKFVSKEISPQLYKDFRYMSNLIHNDDYNTKIFTFFDEAKLTGFIYTAYYYTDLLISTYDKRYERDLTYRKLCINLLEVLDEVNNSKI